MALFLVAGCAGINEGYTGIDDTTAADVPQELVFNYSEEDLRTEPQRELIEYDLNTADDDLVIMDGGDYRLAGRSKHKVIIDTDDQLVHIFLDGVDLESDEGNAVLVLSASKVVITCMDDTENRFADSPYYGKYRDYDACIYSVPDITVNGTGKLIVRSVYEGAVHTKDIFKAIDTSIDIQAKGDGIKGNDGVSLVGVTGNIDSEKNGIRTTKNGKDVKGSVVIRDTDMSIIAGKYAINSYDGLDIRNSDVFMKGILGDTKVALDTYIQEGPVADE